MSRQSISWVFPLVILTVPYLTGCEQTDLPVAAEITRAELTDTNGKQIGSATLVPNPDGVFFEIEVSGLSPGEHGFHIHENGSCDPPEFASAGGHFNPTDKMHGFEREQGPHLGDLPNLVAGDDGSAEEEGVISGVTLESGERSILGKAIVIHAEPDDYVSQPAGAAGARVACGVIQLQSFAPAREKVHRPYATDS